MNLPLYLLYAAVAFFMLMLIFRPLEWAFPAREQKFFRPAWWTDLCFFLGQYMLWTTGVIWLLKDVFGKWIYHVVPLSFRAGVASQPWWLQAIEVIFLSDFFVYWGHRLQHRTPFLWRFHSIHHSAEHLDWLAAHREHPVDTIYTMTLINLPPFILGFPLETLAFLAIFRGVWAIYIHSNVRFPLPILRWFIGAPELHHWHHDKDKFAGNYANISPLMDLMFGTYKCPDHEPAALGIDEPIRNNYLAHLIHPFVPMKPKEEPRGFPVVQEDLPTSTSESAVAPMLPKVEPKVEPGQPSVQL